MSGHRGWSRTRWTTSLRRIRPAGLSIPFLVALPVGAQSTPAPDHLNLAFGVHASTLGFGVQVGKLLSDHFAARAAFNYLSLSPDHTVSDINYAGNLRLLSVPLLVDFSPSRRGSFHLTAGLAYNGNRATAVGNADSTGTFTINHHDYTKAQIGVLNAKATFPGASFYTGLGFGTPARTGSPIAFLFDLGVLTGKPTVDLTATNPQNNPQLTNDLIAQSATTQHDVRKYLKVWPVLAFGLAYRI